MKQRCAGTLQILFSCRRGAFSDKISVSVPGNKNAAKAPKTVSPKHLKYIKPVQIHSTKKYRTKTETYRKWEPEDVPKTEQNRLILHTR